ncbi:MAG: NAD-dependent SIR2 family protein deacetylase [Candidatus Azotimanducaceae bacterium]|jgi:NAD-dependent SIR2 family protein deacetylase
MLDNPLVEFVIKHPRLLVITGAGCSAASGIPTYRDDTGAWQRSAPIQHQDFINLEASRKRYWARSYAGWPMVNAAKPNASHYALASLEKKGYCQLLVTQNIDRLHQKAGHQNVIDLHGRLDKVSCLNCESVFDRQDVQSQLARLNPTFPQSEPIAAPDGDAYIENSLVDQIVIQDCPACQGMLKPEVVFYGGTVDRVIVNSIYKKLSLIDAVLVVGSSLMVFSSFRFCRKANEISVPVAAVNQGKTRADDFLDLKVSESCTEQLVNLAETLPVLQIS